MKKLLITMAILMAFSTLFAQDDIYHQRTNSFGEPYNHYQHLQIGIVISTVGVSIAILAPDLLTKPTDGNDYAEQEKKYTETTQRLRIGGVGIAVAGAVVQLVAINHINKENKLMQLKNNTSLHISDNGLGLALKF